MKRVLFVYNANSRFWSKKIDFAHKILSPATYNCSLCELTHGKFKERNDWRNFRESTSIIMDFQYKNDFLTQYPKYSGTFPVVFLKSSNGELEVVMEDTILKQLNSVSDLINELQVRLIALI